MKELEKQMYFGATAVTLKKARQLRSRMTPSEVIIWEKLKNKQICGVRFRRQHPIEIFIVDFYCHAAKLVVEIDGKIHLATKDYDNERTKEINKYNILILRYTNDEISNNLNKIIKEITYYTNLRLNTT
ncbi:endonuclease domain-containing protein [uncultured Draconibacterium sp.]|uniref:endonuclease domain-containing protein n=1 Tax=uncultured Draconibacterium sp. TaxID=1573823 RepID=UPI0029C62609|nr:endonuclease domain-containing protein [uncultured Draconibacterium sp.]